MEGNKETHMQMDIYLSILLLLIFSGSHQVLSQYENIAHPMNIPKLHRIVHGEEAVPHSFPFLIQLLAVNRQGLTQACSATLVTKTSILTAAHCLYGFNLVQASLGYHNLEANDTHSIQIVSRNFIIHEEYDDNYYPNDIGILILPEPVELNEHIQLVTLDGGSNYHTNTIGTLLGWGLYEVGSNMSKDISMYLRYGRSRIMSNYECKTKYYSFLQWQQVCVSGAMQIAICGGDSGGPLLVDGETPLQVGIASFSHKDCTLGNPSGYIRVNSFKDWIKKNCPDCRFSGGEIQFESHLLFTLIFSYFVTRFT